MTVIRDYDLVPLETADNFVQGVLDHSFSNWFNFTEEERHKALKSAWRTIFRSVVFKYTIQAKKYKDSAVFEAVIIQAYHVLTDMEAQLAIINKRNGVTSLSAGDYSASYDTSSIRSIYPDAYETLLPVIVLMGRF